MSGAPVFTVLALVAGLGLGLGLFMLLMRATGKSVGSSEGTSSAHGVSRAIRLRPGMLRQIALSAGIGVAAALVTVLITGVIGLSVAVGGLGAGVMPWLHIRRQRKRDAANARAFPDGIETIISRVRSGQSLIGSLEAVSEHAPPAIAGPAAVCVASYRMTGNAEACLDQLKYDWASPVGDLLVETLRVAHQSGGRSSLEVLRELADQVRRDTNTRRDVAAKQSWVHVAARVGVAAPWIVLLMLSFRPEAVVAYNSPAGLAVLIVGLAMSVCAYWAMLALGRISQPERMFSA